mgnify:CR=1 FL=1
MQRLYILVAVAVSFSLCAGIPAHAADSSHVFTLSTETKTSALFPGITYQQPKRPKIGIALSGGGLKGIAHVGVLKALRENNIPIDYITGTSAGSIIGGLYAIGYTVDEIDSIARAIDYETLFLDKMHRRDLFISQKEQASKYLVDVRFDSLRPYIPISITPGQGIGSELTNLFMYAPGNTIRNFNNYRAKFKVVATDLETGDRVVIGQGNWVEAIRGSMSIPMVLSPVEYKNRRLIDGGVADNIPINLAKEMGADIVVALDVRAKLYEPDELKNLLTVADQVINILMNTSREEALDNADVVVTPDFTEEVPESETQAEEYIARGYQAGMDMAETITKIYRQHLQEDSSLVKIDSIAITGNHQLSRGHLWEIISFPQFVGDTTLAKSEITRALRSLIESAYFRDVSASITNVDSIKTLVFHVSENPVVNETEISGVTLLPDSVSIHNLSATEGVPYNPKMLDVLLTNLIKEYRELGYAFAKVDTVQWYPDTGKIQVIVSEGAVNKILVAGNKISRKYIITREVKIRPNEYITVHNINRSITNLYSTDLFDYAGVEFVPAQSSDGWNLVFHVQEKKYLSTKFGYRVDNQRGNTALLTIEHQNFRGHGVRVAGEVKMGGEQAFTHLHYTSNRFFRTYITYNFALGYEWDWYNIYDDNTLFRSSNFTLERSFISYTLGHQIAKLGLVDFTGKVQRVMLDGPNSRNIYNSDTMLVSLSAQSVIDTKDRTAFARSGNFQQITYETASKDLAGDIGYSKFELVTEWFFTFLNRNTVNPRIRVGIGDQTLPFSEYFKMGGIDSFFGLQEMQVWAPKIYQGSLAYRYRLPVSSLFDMNFYIRYDIAAYSERVIHKISKSDFMNGRGFGLGITTPAGPLNIGYGVTSTNEDAFYFYFGWDF